MRTLATVLSLLALGACATAEQRDGGYVTYDGLQQAQANCAAKGLTLKLKDGGNSRILDHYACQKD